MLGASDPVVAHDAGPRRKLPAERQVSSRLRHATQQQVTTSCRTFTMSPFPIRRAGRLRRLSKGGASCALGSSRDGVGCGGVFGGKPLRSHLRGANVSP
jgi:hypothetical protein